MNEDLLHYKIRFVTIALLLGYVYLHIALTGSYVDVTLFNDINFLTRMPFGQRILVPGLAHLMLDFIPIGIDGVFFLLEWLFISLFYFALVNLLEQEFTPRQAQLLSWLFLLLLPLMSVLNYRFTMGGESPFYFTYDTPSLFFLAVGYGLCLRAQWAYLIPWIFIATINRESSILLVLLIPILHWKDAKSVVKPLFFSLLAYVLARCIILYLLKDTPGHTMEFYYHQTQYTIFSLNMHWLLDQHHILLFLFCFAGLPFFWFAFYDYIPLRYRPLRYLALLYFLGLLLVGRIMEARLFSEIAILLYLPVCLALRNWLMDIKPFYSDKTGPLSQINRYLVLGTFVFIILFHNGLNRMLVGVLHQ